MSEEREIRAIPTVYRGIQLKSRLESQCAFLLDQLGWDWQYEPQSFMLPNGVNYTPDFYVEDRSLFIECRGYNTEKGLAQLRGFAQMAREGIPSPTEYADRIHDFVVLPGDSEAITFRRNGYTGMVAVIHCKECGWRLPPLSSQGSEGMNYFHMFCESCISPMSLPSWEKWDGKARIDRVAIITIEKGKVLVNGSGVEEFCQ